MPVYNGEKYLREAIESILNQTYENYEFLIINDGSADESENIINSYKDNRIVYVKNDRNYGLIYTLNRGINLSKGEFIGRMDADDISLPARFEKQMNIFKKNPDIGVCGCWAQFFGKVEKLLKLPVEDEKIKAYLLFGNPIIHSAVMMRKSVLMQTGSLYNSDFHTIEDYELWVRLALTTRFYNIPKKLVRYRVHDVSVSNSLQEQQKKMFNSVNLLALKNFGIEPSIEEKGLHFAIINRTPTIKYDDKQMRMWAGKLISQNEKFLTVDMMELKSLLIRKWFSYLYRHKNTSQNSISLTIKLKRYLILIGFQGLISLGFSKFVKFRHL